MVRVERGCYQLGDSHVEAQIVLQVAPREIVDRQTRVVQERGHHTINCKSWQSRTVSCFRQASATPPSAWCAPVELSPYVQRERSAQQMPSLSEQGLLPEWKVQFCDDC